jgi:hypothetical protein
MDAFAWMIAMIITAMVCFTVVVVAMVWAANRADQRDHDRRHDG